MKILITGSQGFLGTHLVHYLCKKKYRVCGLSLRKTDIKSPVNYSSVDLTNFHETKNVINEINPDIIVNTVALTNVDECEKKPILANQINVKTVSNIINIIYEKNIKFIHISSDQLYDGRRSFYNEKHIESPINIYGKTKLEADRIISSSLKKFAILRTNFFGKSFYGNLETFAEWIYKSIINKQKIKMFHDVYFNPVYIKDLLKAIEFFINNDHNGIFNISNSKKISKYEFGKIIENKISPNFNCINPCSIEKNNFFAKRPKDMSLDNKKFTNLSRYMFLDFEESINKFIMTNNCE